MFPSELSWPESLILIVALIVNFLWTRSCRSLYPGTWLPLVALQWHCASRSTACKMWRWMLYIRMHLETQSPQLKWGTARFCKPQISQVCLLHNLRIIYYRLCVGAEGWWWSYRWDGCQASDHCWRRRFNIFVHETIRCLWDAGTISRCVCGDRTYFKPKRDLRLNLTECFWCPILARVIAQHCPT